MNLLLCWFWRHCRIDSLCFPGVLSMIKPRDTLGHLYRAPSPYRTSLLSPKSDGKRLCCTRLPNPLPSYLPRSKSSDPSTSPNLASVLWQVSLVCVKVLQILVQVIIYHLENIYSSFIWKSVIEIELGKKWNSRTWTCHKGCWHCRQKFYRLCHNASLPRDGYF